MPVSSLTTVVDCVEVRGSARGCVGLRGGVRERHYPHSGSVGSVSHGLAFGTSLHSSRSRSLSLSLSL